MGASAMSVGEQEHAQATARGPWPAGLPDAGPADAPMHGPMRDVRAQGYSCWQLAAPTPTTTAVIVQ
jgi:hypothetical protein